MKTHMPDVLSQVSSGIRKIAAENTAEQIKAEINRQLVQLDRRLVVLVDDIDRLDSQSIRLMFRLIRLNADFHNTTYLVAFARSVVEKALEAEQGASGRAYLEKIVQVQFDLPVADPISVSDLLRQELDKLLSPIPDHKWDKGRWTQLYVEGFRQLFQTVRDVARYVNSLSVTLPIVAQEVDPVDFFGIEAIRVFAPDQYYRISTMKDTLTANTDLGSRRVPMDQDPRAVLEKYLQDLPEDRLKEPIRRILSCMFPQIEALLKGYGLGGSYRDDWKRARRICDVESFDRYFMLSVARDSLSETEWRAMVASAGDLSQLTRMLEELSSRALIVKFLDRLLLEPEAVQADNIANVALALLHLRPDPRRYRAQLSLLGELGNLIHSLIYKLVSRIGSEAERESVLIRIAQEADSLPGLVQMARSFSSPSWAALALAEERLRRFQVAVVERIREAAASSELSESSDILVILWGWRELAGDDEPKEYVVSLVSTNKGLLQFLVGCLNPVVTTIGYETTETLQINRDSVVPFVDLDLLTERVSRLRETKRNLDDLQRNAVDAFLDPDRSREVG